MASGELTAKAETGEFLVSDRSIKIISPQKRQKKGHATGTLFRSPNS